MTVPVNRVVGGLGIVVIWVMLFGEVTAANVLGGIAVAIVVMVAFPHGSPRTRHRVSPWGAVRLLTHLAVQLVVSSLRVARAVIRPTPERLRTQVVRVPLRTDSELVGTVVADMITLTPGTLTLDVRHDPERLIVHALGAADPAAVRESVVGLEDQVLRAIRPVGGGHVDVEGGAR